MEETSQPVYQISSSRFPASVQFVHNINNLKFQQVRIIIKGVNFCSKRKILQKFLNKQKIIR